MKTNIVTMLVLYWKLTGGLIVMVRITKCKQLHNVYYELGA